MFKKIEFKAVECMFNELIFKSNPEALCPERK